MELQESQVTMAFKDIKAPLDIKEKRENAVDMCHMEQRENLASQVIQAEMASQDALDTQEAQDIKEKPGD